MGPSSEFTFKPTREGMKWAPKFQSNWLNTILGLNTKESETIRQSHLLFSRLMEQADNPVLYDRYHIQTREESFLAYQSVLNIHLWPLHKRFVKEGRKCMDLHQEIYDRHWDDAIERIRELKVMELLINKNLTQVQQMSYSCWLELDQGFELDDNNTVFGAGLWRSVYLADESAPEQKIEDLCVYVRQQTAMVDALPLDDLLWGRFAWVQPEAIDGPASGSASLNSRKRGHRGRPADGKYKRLR